MKQNRKIIYLVIAVALFFLLTGGFVVDKFSTDPVKQEYKQAKKELKTLRDSLKAKRAERALKLETNKERKSDVETRYKNAGDSYFSSHQLDSLRAEFRRKTGG